MKSKNIYRYFIGTGLILLVPLIAMQFSNEVDWNWYDFVVIGGLLLGTGLAYEFLSNKLPSRYRAVTAVVLLGTLFLIWAELAVGVFGSPFAGS